MVLSVHPHVVSAFFATNHHKRGGDKMKVGILKEIKTEENRVCMTPAGVEVMIANGPSCW